MWKRKCNRKWQDSPNKRQKLPDDLGDVVRSQYKSGLPGGEVAKLCAPSGGKRWARRTRMLSLLGTTPSSRRSRLSLADPW